jgi:anti-sigma factor (TIGR02949 family)
MDDIDCTKVLHALYEFLDGELTSERRQHIELHLNGCPHCFSAFDFEAELRIVVRSRLRAEVPADLRRRIVAALEREGFRPLPESASTGFAGAPVFGGSGSGVGFGASASPFGTGSAPASGFAGPGAGGLPRPGRGPLPGPGAAGPGGLHGTTSAFD